MIKVLGSKGAKKVWPAVSEYVVAYADLAGEIEKAELKKQLDWWKGTCRKEHWTTAPDESCAFDSIKSRTFETARTLRGEGDSVFHVITTVCKVD